VRRDAAADEIRNESIVAADPDFREMALDDLEPYYSAAHVLVRDQCAGINIALADIVRGDAQPRFFQFLITDFPACERRE